MGFFSFDGKNSIFQDLIAELPNGTVYLKENNVIPFANVVTYVEQFDTAFYPVGTDVKIYVNDAYTATAKVTPSKAIYYKMATPYGKFRMRTEVGGVTYSDAPFFALNTLSFLVALAKTYNYDYLEIFKMFGNVWDKYLQDDMLYNKIGWFYDFSQPYGWDIADYRAIIIGSANNIQINHLFLNSMTYWSMWELVKSFVGQYPYTFTYRDADGWIISSDTMPMNVGFPNFYLEKEWSYTGSNDMTGVNLNGYILTIQIDFNVYNINFTTTTGATDIVNQINAQLFTAGFLASVVTIGSAQYVKLYYNYPSTYGNVMVIQNSSAVEPLGFQILQFQQDDFVNANDDIITLYDDRYYSNKLDMVVNNGTKQITENATKSSSNKDKLKHKDVIDTPLHPLSIPGFIKGVDYQLLEFPVNSTEFYIEWLNPPIFMQGTGDITGVNLAGLTLNMSINNISAVMTFNNTPTPADIASQINSRFGGVYANVITVGAQHFIRLSGWGIKIVNGTALTALGFTFAQTAGLPQKNDQYIVIYSYFMKEEMIPLCELNKPAYLKINYYFME